MTSTQLIWIAVLSVFVFWAVGAHNRLVRLKNTIANTFGQIDVQLKRRYDLVPNLAEAAKKHLSHERETLEAIITVCHQAKSASDVVRSRPSNALAVTALAVAEQALTNSLDSFFVLREAYPALKADETIRELSQDLTSTEHKATFARQAFNDAVLDYNNAQRQFPALLIAKVFSFEPSAMLEAPESAEERKTVRMVL